MTDGEACLSERVQRLRRVASSFAQAGLATHLQESRIGYEVVASLPRGHTPLSIRVAEDGRVQLDLWLGPDANAPVIASVVLAIITSILLRTSPAASSRRRASHFEPVDRYDGSIIRWLGVHRMAGAPDRLADPDGSVDAVRAEEATRASTDFRARLERLPPGHPSSPYEADGTAKPSVPDLSTCERPIPGDTGYEPTSPDNESGMRSQSSTDHADAANVTDENRDLRTPDSQLEVDPPVIGDDGSWEWKGRHLTPEQSRIADRALERLRSVEGRDSSEEPARNGGLTFVMRVIESQISKGRLADRTEEFALKSADRFKEKVADRISLKPDSPVEDVIGRIHDGIRYTFLYDKEDYLDGFWETESAIKEHGYDLTVRKPCWDGEEYKGLNSQWLEPDSGVFFEVQFHTPESWAAKQSTHAAYERLADPKTPGPEREKLESFQRQMTALVPIPIGAPGIPHYRKGGIAH